MIDFIDRIGILANHSNVEAHIWDVRPQRLTGGARSHTSEEFPMHTDCSFEDPPPRYIALYVVQEDQYDGGLTTLIDTEILIRYLSRKTLRILHTKEFYMRVPQEFFKGTNIIKGRILSYNKLWRYRSDTIIRDDCADEEIDALNELDSLLDNPHIILTTKLPTGSMLILDNSRWFHGRTCVMDPQRWLKRIRFDSKFNSQPNNNDNYNVLSVFKPVLLRSETFGIPTPRDLDYTNSITNDSLPAVAPEIVSRTASIVRWKSIAKSETIFSNGQKTEFETYAFNICDENQIVSSDNNFIYSPELIGRMLSNPEFDD